MPEPVRPFGQLPRERDDSPRETLEAAFDELVEPYVQRLYRFLAMRLGDDAEARDALQETLLAAWLGLPTLRERDRLWAWLVSIAANKAADAARRTHRSAGVTLPSAADDERPSWETRAALSRLPHKARQVLLLRYLARLSEEETAGVLGIRVGTVKSRAARARKLLLEELS